jgi:hypothetical protein
LGRAGRGLDDRPIVDRPVVAADVSDERCLDLAATVLLPSLIHWLAILRNTARISAVGACSASRSQSAAISLHSITVLGAMA